MKIQYNLAVPSDTSAIAALHTLSWQIHYKSVLSDNYLQKDIPQERLDLWTARLQRPTSGQITLVAKQNDKLIGFCCTFLDHDEQYGHMLDNLHVHPDLQSQGVGFQLMQRTAKIVSVLRPQSPIYLWVLKINDKAIRFYDRLGGKNVESNIWSPPDGSKVPGYRYAWDTAEAMMI